MNCKSIIKVVAVAVAVWAFCVGCDGDSDKGTGTGGGDCPSTKAGCPGYVDPGTNPGGGSGTFTDSRDGKIYKKVTIGAQTWMAENLNYATSDSMCYNNDPANCDLYGKLYTWDEAMAVCPAGWHLPHRTEWEELLSFVGGSSIAGSKLKALTDWNESLELYPKTDEYGFSALPGGRHDGKFSLGGEYGYWWTSRERDANDAYHLYLRSNSNSFTWNYLNKGIHYSVRCVQD